MPRWTAVTLACLLGACGAQTPGDLQPSPSPSPSPTAPPLAVGPATGPTAITLVSADPAPGSTLAGCGAGAAGCAGRIRMTFRLTPSGSGPVLWCVAFLHATNKTACLQGRTAGMTLRAGDGQTVDVVFDMADDSGRCGTPVDIANLAFNVEGVVQVASRQEWALRYQLNP